MFFIQYIKVPSKGDIDISIFDTKVYRQNISYGDYEVIPYAHDGFLGYATGYGGNGGLLFFSGDGFWNGKGQSQNYNYYVSDSFLFYPTGNISGFGNTGNGELNILTGSSLLNSGIFESGYSIVYNSYGYIIWSGYL